MSKKQDWETRLRYRQEGFSGCCGIEVLFDLSVVVAKVINTDRDYYATTETINFDSRKHYISASEIKLLKEKFDKECAGSDIGMLLASTIPYQTDVIALLKATGWKKRGEAINPNSDNTITLWSWGSK